MMNILVNNGARYAPSLLHVTRICRSKSASYSSFLRTSWLFALSSRGSSRICDSHSHIGQDKCLLPSGKSKDQFIRLAGTSSYKGEHRQKQHNYKAKYQNKNAHIKNVQQRLSKMSYVELSEFRRKQAERSVLIQVSGRHCCNFIYNYCAQYGKVASMFYESHMKDYILVEYESEEAALKMTSSAGHFGADNIPVETRILYFVNPGVAESIVPCVPVVFEAPRGVQLADLQNASTMREQMMIYYHAERLTELETRLRYFVCSLLEDALTPLFPLVEISPYGSSANRLGRHRSDLDMVLNLNNNAHKLGRADGPFRYMTKKIEDERQFTQSTLRVVADVLHLYVPHVSQLQKIVHARVPIVHFQHDATATSCDLSLSNNSVLTMSKLLYLLGESDLNLRPIIFALRKWASLNDLTINRPGPRFSNFMLTLMVLAFLQLRPRAAMPALSKFLKQDADGHYVCMDQLELAVQQTTSPDELLVEFLRFYAEFDFSANGLSLYRGCLIEKPASTPLFIENPLDHDHNCAQNVHQKELEYLQACLRTSYQRLVANMDKSEQSWGILTLVESRYFGTDINVGVNVRNLFS